jgi:riboflavin synthase
MFTGIIQDVGTVIDVLPLSGSAASGTGSFGQHSGLRLVICTHLPFDRFLIGASVCCNGACLTVVEKHAVPATGETLLMFDVGPTTLKLTELGGLKRGSAVNLEPSLRMGDDLGGHEVSGHIDCKVPVVALQKLDENFWKLTLAFESQHKKFLNQKGSISVKGTSLTIAEVFPNPVNKMLLNLEIMIIPHTLANTCLGSLEVHELVEIEFDKFTKAMVENIERLLPIYLK